jgi:hypothetical protein
LAAHPLFVSIPQEDLEPLVKTLELEVGVAQRALDELEGFRLVKRLQVGMLVLYRAAEMHT